MKIAILTLLIVLLGGCQKQKLKREIEQFIGQEIRLPENMRTTFNGADTTLSGFLDAESKMIIFYDSLDCASCAINKMAEWSEIIATSKGLQQKFNAVFVFAPKAGTEEGVKMSLKANRLNYPVFIDPTAELCQLNPQITKNKMFHVFLLNNENKVTLVGNPLHNPALWELYKENIKEGAK